MALLCLPMQLAAIEHDLCKDKYDTAHFQRESAHFPIWLVSSRIESFHFANIKKSSMIATQHTHKHTNVINHENQHLLRLTWHLLLCMQCRCFHLLLIVFGKANLARIVSCHMLTNLSTRAILWTYIHIQSSARLFFIFYFVSFVSGCFAFCFSSPFWARNIRAEILMRLSRMRWVFVPVSCVISISRYFLSCYVLF